MQKLRLTTLLLFMVTLLQAQNIKKSQEQYLKVYGGPSGKVYPNTKLKFCTEKDTKLDNMAIPANTCFYGAAQFKEGRVYISINKVKIDEQIYDVKWDLLGDDYNEGLIIPFGYKYFEISEDEKFTFKISNIQ